MDQVTSFFLEIKDDKCRHHLTSAMLDLHVTEAFYCRCENLVPLPVTLRKTGKCKCKISFLRAGFLLNMKQRSKNIALGSKSCNIV